MAKNKGVTEEKLKLIGTVRDYLIDVIACGVAAGMPGIPGESIRKRRQFLEQKEREIIDQIEKLDG